MNFGFRIFDFEFGTVAFHMIERLRLGDSGGFWFDLDAGWSSPVARWAHNPKVAGSNPAPATNLFEISKFEFRNSNFIGGVAQLAEHMVCNHGVRGSTPLTSTSSAILDLRSQISNHSKLERSKIA